MPTLARSRSASPPSSPPRMSPTSSQLKMKSPEELLANPMDLLKNANPFLMPAQLLALNPQLYAAQLAQLQAAQLMLAKQTLEQQQEVAGEAAAASRKRGGDTELSSLLRRLYTSRTNLFSDVTIVCADSKLVAAHKLVLAVTSQYFQAHL